MPLFVEIANTVSIGIGKIVQLKSFEHFVDQHCIFCQDLVLIAARAVPIAIQNDLKILLARQIASCVDPWSEFAIVRLDFGGAIFRCQVFELDVSYARNQFFDQDIPNISTGVIYSVLSCEYVKTQSIGVNVSEAAESRCDGQLSVVGALESTRAFDVNPIGIRKHVCTRNRYNHSHCTSK